MTVNEFRKLALEEAGSSEGAHMGHPDFRIQGKIFATLDYPDEKWGMVKLSPEQQDSFVGDYPGMFVPVKGAWGRQGCTSVCLAKADAKTAKQALELACRHVAAKAKPKRKAVN
jgi:hypothetical protein